MTVEGKEVNRQALHLLNEPWDGEWKRGLEEWTRELQNEWSNGKVEMGEDLVRSRWGRQKLRMIMR